MASSAHIRKNDVVQVMAGSDAATRKTGKVLQVMPAAGKAIVERVNYVKKAVRKSQDNPQGGFVEKEAPVRISNLLLYCPRCKKGVRVRRVRTEAGKMARRCKKCSHGFDE